MTYCIAMSVEQGLVFLSDTRTTAGLEEVGSARKMVVFEQPGDRLLVLLGAGNLALTQAVLKRLQQPQGARRETLADVPTMADAARLVSEAVRDVYHREAKMLQEFDLDFDCSFILGGQIGGAAGGRALREEVPVAGESDPPQLFMIYPSGSIVETSNVWTYFQIGESRFGKAIVDWAIKGRNLSLDQATRCALLSMDATLGSNLSVGMPLDLLVYERDALRVTRFASLDQHSDYYRALHDAWCDGMSMLITGLPGPLWTTPAGVPRGHHAESSTAKR